MSNMPKTFKQADLERAIRAVRAVNLPIIQTRVRKDGTIELVHDKGAFPLSDFDDILDQSDGTTAR